MQDIPRAPAASKAGIALSMLMVLYALGFTNLFLRGSLGILAPTLSSEMSLTPETLSLVASSFFFAYALMQLPSGMLLDRFGARRTLSALLLFTTAGAAVFSLATSAEELVVARILMGIGCAGIFSGAFYVVNQWVAPERVVTQSGLLNSFAALGGLAATAPLAALISVYAWRDCFWFFTIAVAVLLVAVAVGLREPPSAATKQSSRSETLSAIFAGVARATAQPGLKRLLVVGVPISAQTTLIGVWGAPYLQDVHGLDELARGNVLLGMGLTGVLGHSFYGYLARRLNSLKAVILGGGIMIFLLTLALAAIEQPPVWLVAAIFAAIAFFAMYPMMAFAHARGLVPPELVGRGVAVTNMGLMSAIAMSQLVFGWIVGQFPLNDGVAPELAYRAAFATLAGLSLLAILIYAPIKDSKPLG
jgi:MFS family permease